MTGRIADNVGFAISVEANFGGGDGQIWPSKKARPAQVLKRAFPTKATMAVVQYHGCPDRTARNYTSAHSQPTWAVLDDLLIGKEGYKVLSALMQDKPPTWWLNIQSELAIAASARAFHKQLSEQIGR